MFIRAGTALRDSGGIIIGVAAIHQHPRYDYIEHDYDISILELEDELEFSDAIGAIALPELNQEVEDGADATVTGWGVTDWGGTYPSVLQVVQVPIVSMRDCRWEYGAGEVTDRMICAGYLKEGGKDACQVGGRVE